LAQGVFNKTPKQFTQRTREDLSKGSLPGLFFEKIIPDIPGLPDLPSQNIFGIKDSRSCLKIERENYSKYDNLNLEGAP